MDIEGECIENSNLSSESCPDAIQIMWSVIDLIHNTIYTGSVADFGNPILQMVHSPQLLLDSASTYSTHCDCPQFVQNLTL